jgi:mono/diheme cytochrome c family protein
MTINPRWLALPALACFAFLMTTPAAGQASKEATEGAKLYKTNCAACHGADGTANTAMGKRLNIKSFKSPEVQGMTDAQLEEIVAKGKGKMPAYEKKLGAEGVKDVVAYIRTLK